MSDKVSSVMKAEKSNSNSKNAPKEENINQNLKDYLATKCRHHTYSWGGTPQEFTCNRTCNYIKQKIGEGYTFSDESLTLFFKEITTKSANYYYSNQEKCLYRNTDISHTLSLIFNTHDMTSTTLREPLNTLITDMINVNGSYDHCIKVIADTGFDMSSLLHIIIDTRFKDSNDKPSDDKLAQLVLNILDCIEIDEDDLSILCQCRHTAICNKVASIVDKYGGEINVLHMEHACMLLPYSSQIVLSMLGRKVPLTEKCLNIICQYAPATSIDMILNNTRMPITRTQFQNIIQSKTRVAPVNSNHYYGRRRGTETSEDDYVQNYQQHEIGQKIEVLIRHGYKPDYEDVIYGIKYKIEIPAVDRFNIKLDRKILEKCWDNDFYPQEYKFDCIDPKLVELQKLCHSRAKAQIGKLVKQNKLVPDRKCMENSCNFANNQPIVQMLLENGGKLTYKCLQNCAKQLKNNYMLTYIMEQYEKSHNEEIESYKKQIAELEKLLDSHGIKREAKKEIEEANPVVVKRGKRGRPAKSKEPACIDRSIDPEELKKKIKEGIQDMKKDKEKIKKEIDEYENDDDDDGYDDYNEQDEIESEEDNKSEEPEVEKESGLIDLDDLEDEFLEEIAQSSKIVNIEHSRLQKMPTEKKAKGKIPSKYAEYFELSDKEKSKQLSFMDLKKDLLQRIRDNRWYDKDDHQLIKLPYTLSQTLKIKDGYIKFGEIDNLLGLFYN